MDNKVPVGNFFQVGRDGDHTIRVNGLGWSDTLKQDAQPDYPEDIFRHVVEVAGFNVLSYWHKDRNFYTIGTEKRPDGGAASLSQSRL